MVRNYHCLFESLSRYRPACTCSFLILLSTVRSIGVVIAYHKIINVIRIKCDKSHAFTKMLLTFTYKLLHKNTFRLE